MRGPLYFSVCGGEKPREVRPPAVCLQPEARMRPGLVKAKTVPPFFLCTLSVKSAALLTRRPLWFDWAHHEWG